MAQHRKHSERVVAPRREELLAAAIDLFRLRGFHQTGMDEIGAEVGVSGPALYRHFRNKSALLAAIFDRVADEMLRGAAQALERSETADEFLLGLVEFHVGFALRDRAIIVVYYQEERNLPAADRSRVRKRQRDYLQYWTDAVAELSGANDDVALARVHACIGLITSVAFYDSRIGATQMRALLSGWAYQTLVGPSVVQLPVGPFPPSEVKDGGQPIDVTLQRKAMSKTRSSGTAGQNDLRVRPTSLRGKKDEHAR